MNPQPPDQRQRGINPYTKLIGLLSIVLCFDSLSKNTELSSLLTSTAGFNDDGGNAQNRNTTNEQKPSPINSSLLCDNEVLLNTEGAFEEEHLRHLRPDVNFFASAVGDKYEDILPMYVFYALTAHNDNNNSNHKNNGKAVAEIVVPDAERFIQRNEMALKFLQTKFSFSIMTSSSSNNNNSERKTILPVPAICVRDYNRNWRDRTKTTNTWRFLETPIRKSARYTYIGDIDVFLLESPVYDPLRMQQMKEWNLPYSNIVRSYTRQPPRLTGLMLVNTDKFYTKSLSLAQNEVGASGNDEAFLYRIVQKAGFGVPPEHSTNVVVTENNNNVTVSLSKYRPSHGAHLSFNRGPYKKMCLVVNQEAFKLLLSIECLEEYRRVDRTVDRILSTTKAIVEEQTQHNMVLFDGICQPNTAKIKERNHNQQIEELKQRLSGFIKARHKWIYT